MAGKLEDTEHAEDSERDESAADVVVVRDDQADVVGQDGHHVDDGHDGVHELPAVRGRVQTQQVLGGEDHHTGRVQAEEGDGVALTARGVLTSARYLPALNRLHHVGHHRDGDEEAGDVVEHQGGGADVRVLERSPHLLAQRNGRVVVTVLRRLVVQQALRVLALAVPVVLVAAVANDLRHDAEEGQLVVVGGDALVLGVVQAPRAVVVEHMAEEVRVAVEEVLLRVVVVEELLLVGAQQGVRVFVQGGSPRLEPPPADVDTQLVVAALGVVAQVGGGERVLGDGHPADGRRPRERQPRRDRRHAGAARVVSLGREKLKVLYEDNFEELCGEPGHTGNKEKRDGRDTSVGVRGRGRRRRRGRGSKRTGRGRGREVAVHEAGGGGQTRCRGDGGGWELQGKKIVLCRCRRGGVQS